MTNREAREGPESSPQSSITANAINAHLLEETRLLRQRNSELIRELTEMRTSSQSARAARQAALNLMEDLQAARRAERREIAERLRAEQDRRSSEVKYRKLFESIDEGFLILERLRGPGEGPPDFRIVEANPASEKESGVRDAAGKTLREAFPGEAEDWYGIFDRIATTGEPIRTQYHLASGGRVLEFYAFRLGGLTDGGIAVLFRDVSERKAVEQQLLDADRRKDEFLATLAHELRNPLAPISNSLQLLRMCFAEDPTVGEVCEVMERQLNHMVRLVDDLLEVSRITRGSIELRKEPSQLASILRSALELSRPLIETLEHQLAIAIPPAPIPIEADPVRLGQVFANLLNNAAKYTDRGGHIRLGVRVEGGEAVVTVRDTGIGLAEDKLATIFDMFTQVERGSDRSRGGLGIGLTLARRLVEMHGGSITAHSAGPGQGSEFVVRLPVAPVENPIMDLPPERRCCELHRRRVLVVDDNQDSAATLGRLLQVLGTDVQIAHDGPTALEMVEGYSPDVVFLDLGMPGMDGLEVARRIRQSSPSRSIVLIALTGWGQHGDRVRTRDAGFDHHLVKPANMSALQSLLS